MPDEAPSLDFRYHASAAMRPPPCTFTKATSHALSAIRPPTLVPFSSTPTTRRPTAIDTRVTRDREDAMRGLWQMAVSQSLCFRVAVNTITGRVSRHCAVKTQGQGNR